MALGNNPTPNELVKAVKALEQGGGGTATDVQVDSTSITSGGVADLKTKNGDYNASTNKLTTEGDLPSKYLEDTLLFSGHGNYVNYLQFVRDKANTAGYKTESLTFNKDDFDSSVVVDGTNRYIEYTISQNIARASAKQDVIDASHKLSADLVDDTSTTNKFVTASDKSTWNGKQDAISDLSTIRSGASAGATAVQPSDISDVVVHDDTVTTATETTFADNYYTKTQCDNKYVTQTVFAERYLYYGELARDATYTFGQTLTATIAIQNTGNSITGTTHGRPVLIAGKIFGKFTNMYNATIFITVDNTDYTLVWTNNATEGIFPFFRIINLSAGVHTFTFKVNGNQPNNTQTLEITNWDADDFTICEL